MRFVTQSKPSGIEILNKVPIAIFISIFQTSLNANQKHDIHFMCTLYALIGSFAEHG